MLRILVAGLLCGIAALGQQPAAPPKLSAKIEFRCLWWSAEQKRNFNPNQPPPKTTEVVIDRWEYTDPVGVPHPDTVTLHASVRNNSDKPAGPVRMKAEIRWKTGPQLKPAAAQWEPGTIFLASLETAPIAPGEQVAMQAPVAIQSKMNSLDKRDWWTHEMEVILTGTDLRTGRTLFREVRPFRIQPGD